MVRLKLSLLGLSQSQCELGWGLAFAMLSSLLRNSNSDTADCLAERVEFEL